MAAYVDIKEKGSGTSTKEALQGLTVGTKSALAGLFLDGDDTMLSEAFCMIVIVGDCVLGFYR